MPRATAGKQKRIERRRDRPYPKQKKVRSKKAQAEKGKGLLAEGLLNERGRTREREKTGDKKRSLSRSASDRREAAAEAISQFKKSAEESRPSSGQSASFSKTLSSRSVPAPAQAIAGKRRAKKGKTKKKSTRAELTPVEAFIRNQIDNTTNIAADHGSMFSIFENSQPMPVATEHTRRAIDGPRSSTNRTTGNRGITEAGLSISPVFQCRVAINSIINQIGRMAPTSRAPWLSSVPYGFTMTSAGQSGAMAANLMNSGVTINKTQWDSAFEIMFGNLQRRQSQPYALTPPPDPRTLNNDVYIVQSRNWKLTYSWMTMLPLLWGVNPTNPPPPLHCEHKLPLFWLAAFGCGPETKLAMFSNIPIYAGIVEDIQRVTRESIPDIQTKIKARIGVGAASDRSSFEARRAAEDIGMRRARVSEAYVAVKHTVREECYAWEFPCVNSAIKSQMIFINLILNPDNNQLYYVIARQAISNYVEGLATNTSTSCTSMWYTILMNILLARGVNISNWETVSSAVGMPFRKRDDVVAEIKRAAENDDEGIIGLVNFFLTSQQKSKLPQRQYTKQYIYDSMVIQLLKLTSLLNNTVNRVCKWDSTLPDGGIRNNLYLNYIRLKRFCEANERWARGLGATKDSTTGHWNQPSTGMFTMLRNLRNNNATLRRDANDYVAQIHNANGQIPISPSKLIQREGSLILRGHWKYFDLGNSNFSVFVNRAANKSLESQAQVDDQVDTIAAIQFVSGYDGDVERSSSSSSADSSPDRNVSLRRGEGSSSRNLQMALLSPDRRAQGTTQQRTTQQTTPQQTTSVISRGYLASAEQTPGNNQAAPRRRTSSRRLSAAAAFDSLMDNQEQDPGYLGGESQGQSQSQSFYLRGGKKRRRRKRTRKKKKREKTKRKRKYRKKTKGKNRRRKKQTRRKK